MGGVTHMEGGLLGRGASLCAFGVGCDPPLVWAKVVFFEWVGEFLWVISFRGAGGSLCTAVVFWFEETGGFIWVGVGLLVTAELRVSFAASTINEHRPYGGSGLGRKRADQFHPSINRLAQGGMEVGTYSEGGGCQILAGNCRS